jgi:Hypoxia induced protein conserved region
MSTMLFHLTTVAALAVLVVLGIGLWNMSREGTASMSQKLMRWRVGLQFVALAVIMLYVWATRVAR